jgi:hypothetical protein
MAVVTYEIIFKSALFFQNAGKDILDYTVYSHYC